jgi:NADPH:quinone reductase-like Zn-dependent oxidoreductase
MKAIIRTKYGSPNILNVLEIEKPKPNDNEILIKIHASSVTKADTMMRKGSPYFGRLFTGLFKPKNPIIGAGFAGIIEDIGKNVQLYRIGDYVFGESIETFGANAEYLCLPEDGVIENLPSNMTFQEAAPVCDGALTSFSFLKDIAKIKTGQKILINGASGSLGTAAIQLAKYFGAEVTGICSTKNMELVKSLGADKVIDYTKQEFNKMDNHYDIIYDTLGLYSFSECKSSLNKKGVYISPVLNLNLVCALLFTSFYGVKKAKFSATGIRPIGELRILLLELKSIIEQGFVKTVIDKDYSLNQVIEAHRYVDQGHKIGNVVLSN